MTGKKKLLLYMCFLWAKPARKLLFQVKCKHLFLVFIEVVSLCFNWKLNLIFYVVFDSALVAVS